MKLTYKVGTLFAVPLKQGGYAIGLVARMAPKGRILSGYFFGPIRQRIPEASELQNLRAKDALCVIRFGDLSLIKNQWPIVGQIEHLEPAAWPMPKFVRRDPLSGKEWDMVYSDVDPSELISTQPIFNSRGLEIDGMFGSGAVEILLSKALK